MEMTFEEYVEKLSECIETAIYDYEVEVMVEAADTTTSTRFKSMLNGIIAIIKRMWEALLKICKNVKQRCANFIGYVELDEAIEIHDSLFQTSKITDILTNIYNNQRDVTVDSDFSKKSEDMNKMGYKIELLNSDTYTYAKGRDFEIKKLESILSYYEKLIGTVIKDLDHISRANADYKYSTNNKYIQNINQYYREVEYAYKQASILIKNYISDINKILSFKPKSKNNDNK